MAKEAVEEPDKIFPRIVAGVAVVLIIGGTYLSYRPYRAPVEAVTVAPIVEPVR
jgi:hypothetical protein